MASARLPGISPTRPEGRPLTAEPPLRLVHATASTFNQELYLRLAPVVNKLLWTFLGPDPERDDLAHEIFIKILGNADKVRDPSQLEAWAVRVTMNALKNEFRSRKRRRFFTLTPTHEDETLAHHPDFEGREVLLRTYRVLERLPTLERLAFTLRLVGQVSLEEAAAACGCSLRTVKRRLQSARGRFLRLAASDPILAERLRSGSEDHG